MAKETVRVLEVLDNGAITVKVGNDVVNVTKEQVNALRRFNVDPAILTTLLYVLGPILLRIILRLFERRAAEADRMKLTLEDFKDPKKLLESLVKLFQEELESAGKKVKSTVVKVINEAIAQLLNSLAGK